MSVSKRSLLISNSRNREERKYFHNINKKKR